MGKGRSAGTGAFGLQIRPLFYLLGIFFLNIVARVIVSPLMPTIERDLRLDHTEAGSLFLFISAGYFLALLASGHLSARLMHRNAIILSCMVVGVSLMGTSLTGGLWGLRAGLLILGMGAGLYLPSALAAITSLVSPGHWGKAIAVHELAPIMGCVAAPLICEMFLLRFSWREVLLSLGAASIAMGLLFALRGRGGEFPGVVPAFHSLKPIFREPSFWIMTVLFCLAIGVSMGIYAMIPLYLVAERGVERSWANNLLGVSRIFPLGMTLLSGWATDRFGPKRTLAWTMSFSGCLVVLLGLAPGWWLVAVVLAQPMLAVCFFPAGFACLSAIGPPATRSLVVSFTVSVGYLAGAGLIPAAIGMAGDAGSFAMGIVMVGALTIGGGVLSTFLHLPEASATKK